MIRITKQNGKELLIPKNDILAVNLNKRLNVLQIGGRFNVANVLLALVALRGLNQ